MSPGDGQSSPRAGLFRAIPHFGIGALAAGVFAGDGVLVLWIALGAPRGVVGISAGVVSALAAFALVMFPARHARAQAMRLASQVEAVARYLRRAGSGSHWEPGQLAELRLKNTEGTFGRLAVAVNELIDGLEIERTFRSIINTSGDLVVVLGAQAEVTFVSESVITILGWSPEEVRNTTLAGFVHAGDLEKYRELLASQKLSDGTVESQARLRLHARDGSWHVLETTVSVHHDGGLGALVLIGRDITDQVAIERELVHQATHDVLTGLPNRKALLQLADQQMLHASLTNPIAVIMIDLDRFKDVNDSLGHAVGDQLLAQVGPRLRSILRPSDSIARLGGDEFAVLLPGADEEGAQMVAERLSLQLVDPFTIDGMELHIEASLGIAVSHSAGQQEPASVEKLFREADIAMYRAKENGTGIASFDPDRDSSQNRSRLEMSADLRRAIPDGQLLLYYQPVVDILEGRLAGVEALVRWRHPERGLMLPGEFLPLAETTGLIIPLSKFVLGAAMRQAAQWAESGWRVQVAVNISPRWLQHGDIVDTVLRMMEEHEVSPDLIRLEITESAILADPEDTLPLLVRLREMGIGISLDDFGTGYSSMTHLRQLPVDEVKVDRAFVQAMTTTPEDAVIVRAAIGLGHDLGMAVVAEGVEDVETLAEIVASGCSLAQGFYFSPPLPAEDLTDWALNRFGKSTSPVLPDQPPMPFVV